MIGVIVHGSLTADPIERQTLAGRPFVTTALYVAAGSDALFIAVRAFDPTASAHLAQMLKCGLLAAYGPLDQTTRTVKDGEAGTRLTPECI